MSDTPSGYIFKPTANSVPESVSAASNDRIKTITKAAVQGYIKTFMDSMGSNRKLMEAVTKMGLQYVTDKSFGQEEDPTKRYTQLVRFFNEIKERLPAILIVDAGVRYVPQTMGLVDNARIINNQWQGQYPIVREVPLSIVVATRDEESTDLLLTLLTLMFGELRNLAGGSRITGNTDKGDRWVITMPLSFEASSVEYADITDDPVDKVWHSSITVMPVFEDRLIIEQPMEKVIEGSNFIGVDLLSTFPPVIDAPSTVKINQKQKVYLSNIQPHYKVVIDKPNIALLDSNMYIIPRQLGTFTLKVIDPSKKEDGDVGSQVLTEKDIKVIL